MVKLFLLTFKIIILIFLIFGFPRASFCETITVTSTGAGSHQNSKISASLNQDLYYGGKNRINFQAQGLKPDGTYTVWLAKKSAAEPMAGLGDFPYLLTVNSSGRANYVSAVDAYKLNNWQDIKVIRHKDGDPQNLNKANLETVFSVDIQELLSGKIKSSGTGSLDIFQGGLNQQPE